MSLRNFVILGRWSLQNNLTQDCITTSPYELHQVLENDKLEKGPVEMLAPDLFAVPYKSKSDFVTSHSKYNIVIALYTTAYARITLYRYMEQIIMAPNYKLLYTGNCRCCLSAESKKICIDTDSVIFLGPRNQPVPFEEGSMLKQMKNEYTDQDIQAFYSGGFVFGACAHIAQIFSHTFRCKQYGIQLRCRRTGKISHVLKCRGLTLDSSNEDKFNFERFKVYSTNTHS